MARRNDTHSIFLGYILWIFGFLGSHRFYFGKPVTGTIWFFTLGLLGVGWIVDAFLIPSMAEKAEMKYRAGVIDYSLAWILLTFLGVLGIHRIYMRKYVTGVIWMFTGGFFALGLLYDFWTLNGQISEVNSHR